MKGRFIRLMLLGIFAGFPFAAPADELAPAAEPDYAGFERLVRASIEKSRDRNAFGKAMSEEARKLNQELASRGNRGSHEASSRGNGNGNGGTSKGENKILKEKKKLKKGKGNGKGKGKGKGNS